MSKILEKLEENVSSFSCLVYYYCYRYICRTIKVLVLFLYNTFSHLCVCIYKFKTVLLRPNEKSLGLKHKLLCPPRALNGVQNLPYRALKFQTFKLT